MSTAPPAQDANAATNEVSIPYEKYQRLMAAMKHDKAVRRKQEHVSELRRRWDESKNSSLKAKKAYDEAVDELANLIEEASDPQQRLPFEEPEQKPSPAENRDAKSEASPEAVPPEPVPTAAALPEAEELPDDDEPRPAGLWREIPVDEMDIPRPSVDTLKNVGVTTLGDYESFQKGDWPEYPAGAASIKGWGAKKVNQADAAFEKLRGHHDPQPAAEHGPARVRVLQASNAMIFKGLNVGTITDAKLVGAHAHVKNRDGEHVTLLKDEFEIVGDDEVASTAAEDEPLDGNTYEWESDPEEVFDEGPPHVGENRLRAADTTS